MNIRLYIHITTNNMDPNQIQEIFENARKDPELFSTIDIEQLLESIESEKNDYLEVYGIAEQILEEYKE